MSRTNIDIDDDACAAVMRRYGLSTKREAVNFALRSMGLNTMAIREATAVYDTRQTHGEQARGEESRSEWIEEERRRFPRYRGDAPDPRDDVVYRRATIEETRRMKGDYDFNRRPTREEWLSRPYVPEARISLQEALANLKDSYEGLPEELQRNDPDLDAWLNRPEGEQLRGLRTEQSDSGDDSE